MKNGMFVVCLCVMFGCGDVSVGIQAPPSPRDSPQENPVGLVCPGWVLQFGDDVYEGNWGSLNQGVSPRAVGMRQASGLDEFEEPVLESQPYFSALEVEDQGEEGVLMSVTITVADTMYLSGFNGAVAHWNSTDTSSGVVEGEVAQATGEQEKVSFRLEYQGFPSSGAWEEEHASCWSK